MKDAALRPQLHVQSRMNWPKLMLTVGSQGHSPEGYVQNQSVHRRLCRELLL